MLIVIEDLSAREAGDLLGINPDAAKQRALTARRELVNRLAERERPWRKP